MHPFILRQRHLTGAIIETFARKQAHAPHSTPPLTAVSRLASRCICCPRLARPSAARRPLGLAAMATSAAVPPPSLVTADWLRANLAHVKVLDATWYLPGSKPQGAAAAEFAAERIPGAQFFDLDGVCDQTTTLAHMLPSEAQFGAVADALGISNDDFVVCYDKGIFSAPRAWWTWLVLGHDKVAVLDGGLPAWKAAGGEVETAPVADDVIHAASTAAKAEVPPSVPPRYRAQLRSSEVRSWQQVLRNVEVQEEAVVDARPAPRWKGQQPEPRPGLAMGHVPGSFNVPWPSVVADGYLLPPEQLKERFEAAGVDVRRPLVATCGSGTTACILALAVRQIDPGAAPVAIYDGSWNEWGALQDVPVAKAPGVE